MNTAQLKIELFRKIDTLEENKLVELYKFLIKKSIKKKDFWNTLNDAQIEDIEAGLNDIEKGKKKDFNKVISKYK
jgi:predicted transcriptional regulator